MKRHSGILSVAVGLLLAITVGGTGFAQKPGGVLRVHAGDSPPYPSPAETGS